VSIFEKEMSLEEVKGLLKESIDTENIIKKKLPLQMFNMAKETYIKEQKEKEIISKMYNSDKKNITNVTIIDDDSAIIETYQKLFGDKEQNWYYTYYKGDIESSVTSNFDIALLQLVAIRNNSSEATSWMAKLVGIDEKY
jgi:hypothetical protein